MAEVSNNHVPALEVSDVSSTNLCEENERSDEGEEHETSDVAELSNNGVSSEESTTNLA